MGNTSRKSKSVEDKDNLGFTGLSHRLQYISNFSRHNITQFKRTSNIHDYRQIKMTQR